jgi:hypothetical protein
LIHCFLDRGFKWHSLLGSCLYCGKVGSIFKAPRQSKATYCVACGSRQQCKINSLGVACLYLFNIGKVCVLNCIEMMGIRNSKPRAQPADENNHDLSRNPIQSLQASMRRQLFAISSALNFGLQFHRLIEDNLYSDLTVICHGDRYPVHKAVICPRSIWFEERCRELTQAEEVCSAFIHGVFYKLLTL